MEQIGDIINEMDWLEPVEKSLDSLAEATLNQKSDLMQQVRNFLHGTWLGHPLHPVITDVPLGAWTTAAVLDLYEFASGDEKFSQGADMAVGIGLIGAAGAAIAGLNDWQFTNDKPKRVGAMHALFNLSAMGFYVASWLQRRRGNRGGGISTGLIGFALSMAGAWLGGHLVYQEKIGVNHAPEELPGKFIAVMPLEELPQEKLFRARAVDIDLVLFRRGTRVFALAEKCAHLGGPLAEGKTEGLTVRCPWHGSRFSLMDGRVLDGPAAYNQPCFAVRVRNGMIEVRDARAGANINSAP
ncbi:MAG TPA: Rieske (2Fe-2S) protein [Terriglobales bacterium]|nr:Rieske (2Fe-2S) protein [Terriglobales bacterium]